MKSIRTEVEASAEQLPDEVFGIIRDGVAAERAMASHLIPINAAAQIEAGKGNVSIVRLLRIARVFPCDGPNA